ncbi:MAG TPA: ATP-binding protein, partial [Candidatus Saccharimonadales bacterium]|nr:ATP-binding protein [Candidatus Saccharimonadales bacterium]
MKIIKKIQENIFRYELFPRGAKVVVGVSGGPDSVCLLDALYKLQKKYNIELIIAHVNYGLRGKDSDLDEKLARELAEKYSLPIEVLKVGKVGKSEEKLRKTRYAFFEK